MVIQLVVRSDPLQLRRHKEYQETAMMKCSTTKLYSSLMTYLYFFPLKKLFMGLSLFVSQVCQGIHILRDLFSYQDGQATPGGRAEEPILEERARRRAIHSKQGMLYIPLFLSQKISLRINALHCRRMLNVSLIFFIIKESCSFTISKKRKKEPCSFIWCILIIVYCPCRIFLPRQQALRQEPNKVEEV